MKKIVYVIGLLAISFSASNVQAKVTRPLQKRAVTPTAQTAPTQYTAQELIDKAEAARKEADALDNEWVSTAEYIKNARLALEAGKEEEAKALASKALFEGEQAVKQAQYMKKHWQSLIPKS